MAEPTVAQIEAAEQLAAYLRQSANSRPRHTDVLTLWRDQATALVAAADWPADHPVRGYPARAEQLIAHSNQYYGKKKAPTLWSIEAGKPRYVRGPGDPLDTSV